MPSTCISTQYTESSQVFVYNPSSFPVPPSPLPTDPTFTLRNVTTAVGTVQNWVGLCAYLQMSRAKHKSREEFLQYYITTAPNASWQSLAGCMYCLNDHAALERVTKYFRRQPGIGGWGLRSTL